MLRDATTTPGWSPPSSPLSPIAYLFFNADLVQRKIDANAGAVAFVDDFTAWVTGPTAQSNRAGIVSIIEDALDWEKRSGAAFEADKTSIIHFTSIERKIDRVPIPIKGQLVQAKDHVKILGVVMDAKLIYRQHIAHASTRGLEAVMELKRLRGLSAAAARQLYASTVTSAMDYASNVWMHACRDKLLGPFNRVQRAGAQAIIGTFMTVATSIAEAEAQIASVHERLWQRAIKLWIGIHTLAETNPLRRVTGRMKKRYKCHRSPLHQVACRPRDVPVDELETIEPFSLSPWEERMTVGTTVDNVGENSITRDIVIAVGNPARNDVVGSGVVIQYPPSDSRAGTESLSFTLGPRSGQNPYSGALAAIAKGLRSLSRTHNRSVTVLTTNNAVTRTLANPRQQSGQEFLRCIHESIKDLRSRQNSITIEWVAAKVENKLLKMAKSQARDATQTGALAQVRSPHMRSTVTNIEIAKLKGERCIPENVGQFTKRLDVALPGRHTLELYDMSSWKERNVLAQLRTDKSAILTL